MSGDEYISEEIFGTKTFISPETYRENKYSKFSDVYSFGLLVYEIMSNKVPFKQYLNMPNSQFSYMLLFHKIRPNMDGTQIPERYKKLIESCWSNDIEKRPTFEKIVYDLRNDNDFITQKVDKKKFLKYIEFIEQKNGDRKLIDRGFPFKQVNLLSIYKELKQMSYDYSYDSSIDFSKYEVSEECQTGVLSSIYKIKEKSTGKSFTAKIANFKIEHYTNEEKMNITTEIEKLKTLNHPSIQRFIDYSFVDFENQPRPVVFSEYNTKITLNDIIETERNGILYKNWNETKKLINIYGIASAMMYLHSHDILHPNLNLNNIFVNQFLYPKLSEIGFFTQVENSKIATNFTTKNRQFDAISMPPEVMRRCKKTKKSDVYIYAYIVYELLTNEVPFNDIKNIKDLYNRIIVEHYRPSLNKAKIPEAYQQLISSCWDDDPDKRPTFKDITYNLEKNPYFITEAIKKNEFDNYIQYLHKKSEQNKKVDESSFQGSALSSLRKTGKKY